MRTLDMNKNIENNNMPAPKLRFPGYTGVWEEKALGEVGTFVRGLSYNKGEVTQDSKFTLVLRSNNIVQDAAVDCKNGLQFVTKGPSSEQILRKGDIVICLSNGSSNLVGKSASYEGDYDGVVTVGAFCGIYRSTAPITKYLVQTPAYKKSIDLIKQGGNGALANLYGRDILGLRFYFPSLEEQKRIVECLEAEDLMIAAQEQKVESLTEKKKGLMQEVFPQSGESTPRLRFPGFTGEWEQKMLGEVFEKNNERNTDRSIGFDKTISIASMTYNPSGNGAAEDSLKTYKVLRIGDIAFEGHKNKDFAYGRFVMNDIGSGIISPRFTSLRPKCPLEVEFWKKLINYEPIMRSILVNSTKMGTMMNELIVSEVLKQTLPVPSIAEQRKIASCLSSLDDTIQTETDKLETLKVHKRGLLQQLFPQP